MKNVQKVLALVLCMVMVFSCLSMNALAADGEPNVSLSVDQTEVNIGDTITVAVNYTDMVVSSFACTLKFDKDLLECVSIEGCDPEYPEDIGLCTKRSFVPGTACSTTSEANGNGQVGFAYAGTKDTTYRECTVFIATFTAKAAGTADFVLVEDSAGTDTYKGTADSETVTIKGSEPEHVCADNNNDHNCDGCGEALSECADNNNDHNCDVCGEALSECADNNNDHNCDVCGDVLSECADNNNDHNCDVCGEALSECSDAAGDENHDCDVCGKENITDHNYGDDFVCDECAYKLAGWQQKDGAWYYVDDDGKAVTGTVRVPYPTVAINGKTYGPNTEDMAYIPTGENKVNKYTDANTAMFMFGDDGKFDYTTNGLVETNGEMRYAVDGVIVWHVGLVEINGEYYYFIGDVNGGGNIMVTGKVYASRNTTGFEIVAGGIYYFGEDGKMCQYEGIVEIDGEKFYFEDNRLMIGAGLTELDGQYIYVRRNGQIAIGKYWVTNHNGITSSGMYTFDENGYLQGVKDPTVNGIENGVYYKNGFPYYAGLIEIDGATYYINSEGKVVTGTYYIIKVNGYEGVKPGDKLTFAADGKLVTE